MPLMMIDTDRLVDSDWMAVTTGNEFKAAQLLWMKAWKQVPAASLPDNDRILAYLAGGLSLRRWQRVKEMALYGWVKCSDGRLYHPVLAELACDAWDRIKDKMDGSGVTRRSSSGAERTRRWRERARAREAEAAASVVSKAAMRDTSPVTVRDASQVTGCDAQTVTAVTSPETRCDVNIPPQFIEKEGGGGRECDGRTARDASPVTVTVTVTEPPHATVVQRELPVLAPMPEASSAAGGSPAGEEEALRAAAWREYSAAYARRYATPPIQNQATRQHVAELVRIAGAQAPPLAGWYVGHDEKWYVGKGHDLRWLVADAAKLHALWAASKGPGPVGRDRPSAEPVRPAVPQPPEVRARLAGLTERLVVNGVAQQRSKGADR